MNKYYGFKARRLIAIFLTGLLLFNYPLLKIFSYDGLLWGIPVLYLYVFISWIALVGLTALVVQSR